MTDKAEDAKVEDEVVVTTDPKDSEGGSEEQVVTLSPEEQRAEGFGWMPKEKWVEDGKSEDDWVPAKHFLKFGELKQQVISKEKVLSKQEKVIKKMKDHHMAVLERARSEALAQLKKERQEALDEGEMAMAEKIRDRIDETKERFAKTPIIPQEIEQDLQPGNIDEPPPEFYGFQSRNPWYEVDPKRQDELSREADAYGYAFVQKKRLSGETVSAGDVYQAVEKFVRKAYPEKFSTPKSPQGDPGSRTGSASSGSESKLSRAELEIAEAFGLSAKEYLAQQKTYKGR